MLRLAILVSLAFVLGTCAEYDRAFDKMQNNVRDVADKLPDLGSGKPPSGAPPKPTDPRYAAYKAKLEGKGPPPAGVAK